MNEVYESIDGFLNPFNHTPLPLIKLPAELNPFHSRGVDIYVKLMTSTPSGNAKSLGAWQMLEEMRDQGQLNGKTVLIENSSGNTISVLATLARFFGIKEVKTMVSPETPIGKRRLLQLLGIRVKVAKGGIAQARNLAAENGWVNPAQYDNPDNPKAHERLTGPELWQQTQGGIGLLCAGVGTGGTLIGTTAYLRRMTADRGGFRSIAAIRESGDNPISGMRSLELLKEVSLPWRDHSDSVQPVTTVQAYEQSLQLIRMGLWIGPSSGAAYLALLNELSTLEVAGQLEGYRGNNGRVTAVFIAPDRPDLYIEEYFQFLPEGNFFPIEDTPTS